MKALIDLCVIPLGAGLSISRYVAECEKIIQSYGLKSTLHANGTNIEGEWDDVFAAVKRCHEVIHQMEAPRIFTSVRINTRIDRDQSMQDKIDSVAASVSEEKV